MRSLVIAGGCAVIWVLLWGSASPANVLSGLAVGAALVLAVPGLHRKGRQPGIAFRPVAWSRLAVHVLGTVVQSNVVMTREVLTRGSSINTGVVGVPLPGCSDGVLTFISNVVALSPGMMPLELSLDPLVLYVHVLHLRDAEDVRRDVLHLTDLTVRAFGSAEEVAAQDEYLRRRGGRTP